MHEDTLQRGKVGSKQGNTHWEITACDSNIHQGIVIVAENKYFCKRDKSRRTYSMNIYLRPRRKML